MDSIFIEQLVKKKRTPKDNIIFILTIVLVIVIPVVLTLLAVNKVITAYFIYISLFIFVFGIWIIWLVRVNQNIEYEYQIIQDTLVVSKITDKRKRKLILKIDIKQFDQLANGDDKEVSKQNFMKVLHACGNVNDDANTYYAVYQHQVYGKCVLLFTPNETIMNSMKPHLKKDVVLKLFYNR